MSRNTGATSGVLLTAPCRLKRRLLFLSFFNINSTQILLPRHPHPKDRLYSLTHGDPERGTKVIATFIEGQYGTRHLFHRSVGGYDVLRPPQDLHQTC